VVPVVSHEVHAPGAFVERRVVTIATLFAVTLFAGLLLLPDLIFGLDQYTPFAQLVAFRPVLALGVLTITMVVVVAARFRPWTRLVLVGLVPVLIGAGALVVPRMIADPIVGVGLGRPLTVLAFNTLEGEADLGGLREAIRSRRPDVISLSEAGDAFRLRLAPVVEPLGYRVYTSTVPRTPDMEGVTALVASDVGDVRVHAGTDTSLPYLELSGGGLGELRFVAFHALAPLPDLMSSWRNDLAQLARWCAGSTPAVVAGDFNATLDHSALRSAMSGCQDAADQRGAGLIPTWDLSTRIRDVGPQIDHVIVTEGIEAQSFEVLDISGSDHRAIFSRLRLPARVGFQKLA
jgi:endonuclease/exonuclease/phosphatase (EEP) superfamily protein YafD